MRSRASSTAASACRAASLHARRHEHEKLAQPLEGQERPGDTGERLQRGGRTQRRQQAAREQQRRAQQLAAEAAGRLLQPPPDARRDLLDLDVARERGGGGGEHHAHPREQQRPGPQPAREGVEDARDHRPQLGARERDRDRRAGERRQEEEHERHGRERGAAEQQRLAAVARQRDAQEQQQHAPADRQEGVAAEAVAELDQAHERARVAPARLERDPARAGSEGCGWRSRGRARARCGPALPGRGPRAPPSRHPARRARRGRPAPRGGSRRGTPPSSTIARAVPTRSGRKATRSRRCATASSAIRSAA